MRLDIKLKVLAHYGPGGKLQCSWPDCNITDVDVLTIDHIHNTGNVERHQGLAGGYHGYVRLWKNNFPDGFQTLCCNHQWKKELLRRRDVLNHQKIAPLN